MTLEGGKLCLSWELPEYPTLCIWHTGIHSNNNKVVLLQYPSPPPTYISMNTVNPDNKTVLSFINFHENWALMVFYDEHETTTTVYAEE